MMKGPAATDSFIICMRENDKNMVKLLRIPQRNRKIRDQEKARHPKERNTEKYDQEDRYRLLLPFSRRVAWQTSIAAALLEHQWNEAPGATHVVNVRLANNLAERLFFNTYPVHMAEEHANE